MSFAGARFVTWDNAPFGSGEQRMHSDQFSESIERWWADAPIKRTQAVEMRLTAALGLQTEILRELAGSQNRHYDSAQRQMMEMLKNLKALEHNIEQISDKQSKMLKTLANVDRTTRESHALLLAVRQNPSGAVLLGTKLTMVVSLGSMLVTILTGKAPLSPIFALFVFVASGFYWLMAYVHRFDARGEK